MGLPKQIEQRGGTENVVWAILYLGKLLYCRETNSVVAPPYR